MNCAILITARLKSTRLPLKVIKEIHGRPMIKHMLDRLKLAKRPEEIVICTSRVEQDNQLVEIASQEGIESFRGDADDVLLRLLNAADHFGVETIINCTADNPFVDPIYIDKLYDFHIAQKNDFTKIEGLPWGVFSYAISRDAMKKACEIKNEKDTEVWHGYFMESDRFRWSALEVTDENVFWPDLRLTVDTSEDFEMVNAVFDRLYKSPKVFPLKDIVKLCQDSPEIPLINSEVKQKAGIPIKFKE